MDTEGIEFHIAHNDYFGTLATVLERHTVSVIAIRSMLAGGHLPEYQSYCYHG